MRLRCSCALLVGTLVSGCSLDSAGTANDIDLFETSAPDTTVPDVAEDVPAVDTEPAPDTSIEDTVADVSDSSAETLDTAEAPPTGALTATGAPSSFVANLTTEGTIAWAHWGFLDPSSFTRKSGTSLFENGVTPAALRWDGFPIEFAWNDGDPTGVVSSTRTGLYRTGPDPLAFTVAAATTMRELRVYVASDTANATATFALTDGSALPVTVALPVTGTPPGAGHRPQVLTANFRAAMAAARLTFRLVKTTGGGSITLFAATLR